VITDRDIALKYIMTLYDVTETEAKKDCYEDELKEAIRLLKIGVHPWTIADQNETKQLDWTDDEYYEGAWSWVDELELKYEDNTLQDALVELNKINRLEIIDQTGRAYTHHLTKNESVRYSLQDDNLTLKIFIANKGDKE